MANPLVMGVIQTEIIRWQIRDLIHPVTAMKKGLLIFIMEVLNMPRNSSISVTMESVQARTQDLHSKDQIQKW